MAVIKSNSITFIDNAGVERYLYIRYSNDGETFTENNGTTPGEWLGICSSNSPIAPTDFSVYTWNKVQGNDGKTFYTWIKYADDINGTNISNNPNGKMYMGIAYNKESLEESEDPKDYDWSLITSRGIDRIEEYYVATANSTDVPNFSNIEPNKIPTLNSTDSKYLWNKEITYFTDGDTDETEAIIIGVYGDSGVGIKDILNYYTTTQNITDQPSFPTEPNEPPKIDSENKYLWNYEKIIYTDNNFKTTESAIIGAYGDEGDVGADAIMFKIYSPNGFEFVDNIDEIERIESIELKTASFKGGSVLTGSTYQWFYLDHDSKEININGATNATLTVNINDSYALLNLGCKMSYNGNVYYDYITLRKKVDVYTASIKFFDGTNVFSQDQDYVVAYVELYKNQKIEEGLENANKYLEITEYNRDTGVITTDYTPVEDENLVYFVYKYGDEYEIILGKYQSNIWTAVDYTTKYTYVNNLNSNTSYNIFVIPKNNVIRSMSLNVDIYASTTIDENAFVATTNATIVDLNDTSVGSTPPSNPYNGQLWLDTDNNVLKVYNSDKADWELSSKQSTGQSIYTSQPQTYIEGDLWVLGDDEHITLSVNNESVQYNSGALLRAKSSATDGFDPSHWEDAMLDVTKVVNNINNYMTFDPSSGLKISQKDENNQDKFYVNVSSTRMSFCSLTDEKIEETPPAGEVVHISGQSASITNLEVEQSMDCNCPIDVNNSINIINAYPNASTYPGFVFQIEEDGGFSLVKRVVN